MDTTWRRRIFVIIKGSHLPSICLNNIKKMSHLPYLGTINHTPFLGTVRPISDCWNTLASKKLKRRHLPFISLNNMKRSHLPSIGLNNIMKNHLLCRILT
jgi:hypothetical protein